MIKKYVLLLCLWMPLSGCVPAALVLGATVGGAVLYDKRSFKTISNDHRATMTSTNAIRSSKSLLGKGHVRVAVFNGIGLIVGEIASKKAKIEAGQIVAKTPSIRRVYNELQIEGVTGSLSRINDSWLASKVRTAMLVKPGLRSTNIKIVAEAGIVYLMGVVNRREALLASNMAREVTGVKKVVKVFEYD